MVEKDPCFIDPQKMNFQLSDNSPAYKLGFQHIPVEKIGLYNDEFRILLSVPEITISTSAYYILMNWEGK